MSHWIIPNNQQQYFIDSIIMSTMSSISNPQSPQPAVVLKNLKQQVLKEAYQKQLNNKMEMSRSLKSVRPLSGAGNNRYSLPKRKQYQANSKALNGNKKQGSTGYIYQKQTLSLQKQISNRQFKIQNHGLFTSLEQQNKLEAERKHAARQQYKRQLQDQIRRKESFRTIDKQAELELERSKLNRNGCLNNKTQTYKQYYDHAERFRNNAAQGYLQYINGSNKNLEERGRERENIQRNAFLLKAHMVEELRIKREKRDQLKRALDQQIVENKQMRASQIIHFKNKGYIKYQNNGYNPIYNPIDYKMDIKNRYIIEEIIPKGLANN